VQSSKAAGLQWKYFLELRQKDCNEKPELQFGFGLQLIAHKI